MLRILCVLTLCLSGGLPVSTATAEQTEIQHFLSCFSTLLDPGARAADCGSIGTSGTSTETLAAPLDGFTPPQSMPNSPPAPSCCSCTGGSGASLVSPVEAFPLGGSCKGTADGRVQVACCPCNGS